ncbi:MAG: hypothetical protein J6M42_11770 [Clostridia bacterium]|nr:hypothetical protein [Clostridia bacterium]
MSRSDETRVKDAAFGGPSGARVVVVGYGTLTVPRVTPVCAVTVVSLPVLRSACRGQSLYGSRWVQQIHRGSEKPAVTAACGASGVSPITDGLYGKSPRAP